MNADGTGQKNLTAGGIGDDGAPCLSRDGKMIAFQRGTYKGQYIFVMNVDGSGKRQVTSGATSQDWDPTWSPDGKAIAYEHQTSIGQQNRLYTVNVDGTSPKLLTTSIAAGDCYDPAWSPGGNRIAFEFYQFGDTGIDTILKTGGSPTEVTSPSAAAFEPAWSPDGQKIAYQQIVFVGGGLYYYRIFTMKADGTDKVRLTLTKATDEYPTWSPDANYLAFDSNRAKTTPDIYVMGVTGTYLKRLTTLGGSHPSWGPVS
jgi:TolB protein